MSNEEKHRNIGIAVETYSSAKVDFAHSEQLLRMVAAEYLTAGTVLKNRIGSTFSSPDEILYEMGLPDKVIIGHERLKELLDQHEQKRLALSISLAQIRNLGLTIE